MRAPGLGVLDGGLAGGLILYHVPASVALGGVLIYHALALSIPAGSGTLGFLAAQRRIRARSMGRLPGVASRPCPGPRQTSQPLRQPIAQL